MRWGDEREALQIALAWGHMQKSEMGLIGWMKFLCPIDRSPPANDPMIVDGLEVGEILRAVYEQRPPVRAWLEYAYGPDRPDQMRAQIAFEICYDRFSTLGAKRFKKHLLLCEIAVDDYAVRVTGDQSDPDRPVAYTPKMYAQLMGYKNMKPEHWEAEWMKKKELVLKPLRAYDIEGVAYVSRTVRCLKKGISMTEEGVKNADQPTL